MRSVCAPGVYATLTTTAQRTMLHKLSARCTKLAHAHELLIARDQPSSEATAAFGQTLAASLRVALQNDSSVRFLPGEELHITLQVSPETETLQVYIQPSPPAPSNLDAALSRPMERAAANVREDVLRGASGSWATPLVHPSLEPVRGLSVEETLLHEAGTDRVLEGLNSNLFVVFSDGSLRTAATSEGAYPGSMREAVLGLARQPSNAALFPGGIEERAPTVAELTAGQWQEAWLTCSSRKVTPLARVWQPGAVGRGASAGEGSWTELQGRERGSQMRGLLEEHVRRESEPIAL